MLTEKIKLEGDEKVLMQVRKHWFVLFTQLFTVALAALMPLVLYFAAKFIFGNIGFSIDLRAYTTTLWYAYTAWLLLTWMLAFNVWTNYYLDVWTITTKRLIAVDQRGLFYRTTGSFRLERLQDLNVEINGIIATFLDYGTLEAQTAGGSEEEFRADGLPHPRELKAAILGASDQLIAQYQNTPMRDAGV